MKFVLIAVLALSGCASKGVIDLKTSDAPNNLIEDTMECDYLAEQVYNTTWVINTNPYWNRCMEGRGYNVLGGSI